MNLHKITGDDEKNGLFLLSPNTPKYLLESARKEIMTVDSTLWQIAGNTAWQFSIGAPCRFGKKPIPGNAADDFPAVMALGDYLGHLKPFHTFSMAHVHMFPNQGEASPAMQLWGSDKWKKPVGPVVTVSFGESMRICVKSKLKGATLVDTMTGNNNIHVTYADFHNHNRMSRMPLTQKQRKKVPLEECYDGKHYSITFTACA